MATTIHPIKLAPLLTTRFSSLQLLTQFKQLLPGRLLTRWLANSNQTFYQRAFTPLVTLWYLVFQRLGFAHQLTQVVADAMAGGADPLSPRGKRLSRQLLSQATTSFSDARQRLPLEICRWALWHIADRTSNSLQGLLKFGLKVGLLDGSTCRVRPFGDIPKVFARHRPGNCKKPPYWCVARVVGILCWTTGVVLDSALSSLKTSEQALSALLLAQRSWKDWLLVADRNFGIYYVVRALIAAEAQGLVRLTAVRARKLASAAGLELKPGLDARIEWTPTRQDQCPKKLSRTSVTGRLIACQVATPGHRPFTLYLFTTLSDSAKSPAQELVQTYGLRWNVELCFRYIKAQMNLGFLECRSAEMVRKEWMAGLIAYNLIRWTMGAAAAVAKVSVHVLSFTRARQLLLYWLARSGIRSRSAYAWNRLLKAIAKARLPKRRKPRPPEPRAIRAFNKDYARLEGSRAVARRVLAKKLTKS